jgi:UDP:flavonoid glycosyltransferase YjiC (YdhE family)
LGGGLGHLVPLRAIAVGLRKRGHSVVLAVSDLAAAGEVVPDFPCLPAPLHVPPAGRTIVEPSTFADILHNAGCGDARVMNGLVRAWQAIFALVKPDVVAMDFSPMALVALQGSGLRGVLLSSGHTCPPDVAPLPDLCQWRDNYPDRLRRTETQVLARLNDQLASQQQQPLARVAQLYARVEECIHLTFRELDHYQNRGDATYWGILPEMPAAPPSWPEGARPRVFTYLKPLASMRPILAELARRELATVAYVPQADRGHKPPLPATLRISSEPVDMCRAAAECDLAVLNTGLYTTARMLLAGKPILAVPISGEQHVVATNAARIGAAVRVSDEPEDIRHGLDQMLASDRYGEAARAFAARYADFESLEMLEKLLDRLEAVGR